MRLVFLAIILMSVFGAGAVDVMFPDVIPLRPYSGVFQNILSNQLGVSSGLSQFSVNPATVNTVYLILIAIMVLFVSLAIFHPIVIPINPIGLTQKASLHPNARHSAGRHKNRYPTRNSSSQSQINEPVVVYASKKIRRKEKIIVDPLEILWTDPPREEDLNTSEE